MVKLIVFLLIFFSNSVFSEPISERQRATLQKIIEVQIESLVWNKQQSLFEIRAFPTPSSLWIEKHPRSIIDQLYLAQKKSEKIRLKVSPIFKEYKFEGYWITGIEK